MAEFDPDEYLKKKEASQPFSPDAYLEKTKPKGMGEMFMDDVKDLGYGVASLADTGINAVTGAIDWAAYAPLRAYNSAEEAGKQAATPKDYIGRAAGITDQPAYQNEITRRAMNAIGEGIHGLTKPISDRTGMAQEDVDWLAGAGMMAVAPAVPKVVKGAGAVAGAAADAGVGLARVAASPVEFSKGVVGGFANKPIKPGTEIPSWQTPSARMPVGETYIPKEVLAQYRAGTITAEQARAAAMPIENLPQAALKRTEGMVPYQGQNVRAAGEQFGSSYRDLPKAAAEIAGDIVLGGIATPARAGYKAYDIGRTAQAYKKLEDAGFSPMSPAEHAALTLGKPNKPGKGGGGGSGSSGGGGSGSKPQPVVPLTPEQLIEQQAQLEASRIASNAEAAIFREKQAAKALEEQAQRKIDSELAQARKIQAAEVLDRLKAESALRAAKQETAGPIKPTPVAEPTPAPKAAKQETAGPIKPTPVAGPTPAPKVEPVAEPVKPTNYGKVKVTEAKDLIAKHEAEGTHYEVQYKSKGELITEKSMSGLPFKLDPSITPIRMRTSASPDTPTEAFGTNAKGEPVKIVLTTAADAGVVKVYVTRNGKEVLLDTYVEKNRKYVKQNETPKVEPVAEPVAGPVKPTETPKAAKQETAGPIKPTPVAEPTPAPTSRKESTIAAMNKILDRKIKDADPTASLFTGSPLADVMPPNPQITTKTRSEFKVDLKQAGKVITSKDKVIKIDKKLFDETATAAGLTTPIDWAKAPDVSNMPIKKARKEVQTFVYDQVKDDFAVVPRGPNNKTISKQIERDYLAEQAAKSPAELAADAKTLKEALEAMEKRKKLLGSGGGGDRFSMMSKEPTGMFDNPWPNIDEAKQQIFTETLEGRRYKRTAWMEGKNKLEYEGNPNSEHVTVYLPDGATQKLSKHSLGTDSKTGVNRFEYHKTEITPGSKSNSTTSTTKPDWWPW